MKFEQPTKNDLDRALSRLMHEARHRLNALCNEAEAEDMKVSPFHQSPRLIAMIGEAAEKIHLEVLQQATSTLREFALRMEIAPSQIVDWVRLPLERFGGSLLEIIPRGGFPDERKRIVQQYQAQFDQRLTDSLRDVEIGFVKGGGFAGMPEQDEWVRAAEAVEMLKPIFGGYSGRLRICQRAHAGLIRAHAEQFHQGERVFHDHNIPKEFWWAEGHEALEQDWTAGDFSTWIEHRTELKAFGVTFRRADVQKLLPSAGSLRIEAASFTDDDDEIIMKLDVLVPSAALSYKQAILDLRDDQQSFLPWSRA